MLETATVTVKVVEVLLFIVGTKLSRGKRLLVVDALIPKNRVAKDRATLVEDGIGIPNSKTQGGSENESHKQKTPLWYSAKSLGEWELPLMQDLLRLVIRVVKTRA